jgi:hypothetical protein
MVGDASSTYYVVQRYFLKKFAGRRWRGWTHTVLQSMAIIQPLGLLLCVVSAGPFIWQLNWGKRSKTKRKEKVKEEKTRGRRRKVWRSTGSARQTWGWGVPLTNSPSSEAYMSSGRSRGCQKGTFSNLRHPDTVKKESFLERYCSVAPNACMGAACMVPSATAKCSFSPVQSTCRDMTCRHTFLNHLTCSRTYSSHVNIACWFHFSCVPRYGKAHDRSHNFLT